MRLIIIYVCFFNFIFSLSIESFKDKYLVYTKNRGIGQIQVIDFKKENIQKMYDNISSFSVGTSNIMCEVWGDKINVQNIRLIFWDFTITHSAEILPELNDGISNPTSQKYIFVKNGNTVSRYIINYKVDALDSESLMFLYEHNGVYSIYDFNDKKTIMLNSIENKVGSRCLLNNQNIYYISTENKLIKYDFKSKKEFIIETLKDDLFLGDISQDGLSVLLSDKKRVFMFDILSRKSKIILDYSSKFNQDSTVFVNQFKFIPEGTGFIYSRYSKDITFFDISEMYRESDLYYFDLNENKDYFLKASAGKGGIGVRLKR